MKLGRVEQYGNVFGSFKDEVSAACTKAGRSGCIKLIPRTEDGSTPPDSVVNDCSVASTDPDLSNGLEIPQKDIPKKVPTTVDNCPDAPPTTDEDDGKGGATGAADGATAGGS